MGVTVQLDTNLLVEYISGVTDLPSKLANWVRQENSLGTSAVAWSEFRNGSVSDENASRVLIALEGNVIGFERYMADKASLLYHATGRRRGSHSDCMIAACAIISGVPLATWNLQDFERFEPHGLKLHTF